MTVFTLKIIALLSMIIDHTGAFLDTWMNAFPLRVIGRIAFPIYAFLLSEGCRKTRSMPRYMGRLFVFALISEIPFDLLFENIKAYPIQTVIFLNWNSQNVFFTLCLGVLAVYLHETLVNRGVSRRLAWIAALAAAWLAEVCNTDYGAVGVLLIYVLYVLKNRRLQCLAIALTIIILYHGHFSTYNINLMLGGAASIIPIAFYNQKKGSSLRWAFYAAYPIHLLVLATVWFATTG